MRAENRALGMRSEVAKQPWSGAWSLRTQLLYGTHGLFRGVQPCPAKHRDGAELGMEI